jgi:hypothetical protein
MTLERLTAQKEINFTVSERSLGGVLGDTAEKKVLA